VLVGLPVGSQECGLARDSIHWLPWASPETGEPRISQELGRGGCAEDKVHAGTSCLGQGGAGYSNRRVPCQWLGVPVRRRGGATATLAPTGWHPEEQRVDILRVLGVDCARGGGKKGRGGRGWRHLPLRGARVSSLPLCRRRPEVW